MSTFTRRLLIGSAFACAALASGVAGADTKATTQSAKIEQLLSKQEITELLYKYPRALDRLDRDLLLSIAHPEAKVTFGKNVFPNWGAYTDFMMKAHGAMLGNNHRISNILIEVGGDKAVSESTGTATLLVKKENGEDVYEERWMHSRYLDTWSRRNGKWALDNRVTLTDYRRVLDVPGELVRNRYEVGARSGRDDPSYQLFGKP